MNKISSLKSITQNKYIRYLLLVMFITILHFFFVSFISIMDSTPDIFLVLVVWIAIKEGRLFGILAGFIIGLYFDFITGDIIGINALTKTITAFIASGYHKKDTTKQIVDEYKFIFVVAICTITHNLIYFLFFINISNQGFIMPYLKFSLIVTFYTTFVSAFVYVLQLFKKKYIIGSL